MFQALYNRCFNSILVQLEADTKQQCHQPMQCFNSILVQLEAALFASEVAHTWFQFHIGAIRSAFHKTISLYRYWFQFHIGAIRSAAVFPAST